MSYAAAGQSALLDQSAERWGLDQGGLSKGSCRGSHGFLEILEVAATRMRGAQRKASLNLVIFRILVVPIVKVNPPPFKPLALSALGLLSNPSLFQRLDLRCIKVSAMIFAPLSVSPFASLPSKVSSAATSTSKIRGLLTAPRLAPVGQVSHVDDKDQYTPRLRCWSYSASASLQIQMSFG